MSRRKQQMTMTKATYNSGLVLIKHKREPGANSVMGCGEGRVQVMCRG